MMTDETDKDVGPGRDRLSRQDRLKLALRENLKRRKLQARERDRMSEPSTNDQGSPREGTARKTER
jgi:hypothetical protein